MSDFLCVSISLVQRAQLVVCMCMYHVCVSSMLYLAVLSEGARSTCTLMFRLNRLCYLNLLRTKRSGRKCSSTFALCQADF